MLDQFLVTIDVNNGLQFVRKNAPMLRLNPILVGLKLNFRDWKPAKNTFH